MRKIIISLLFVILFLSPISAEIIIDKQPNEVYNLGELISIPVTIKAVGDISGIFQMDLLCEGHQVNFYKNGISLLTGEEKKIDASVVLVKEMISELKGECKIKAILGETYLLTNEFKISDFLTMQIETEEKEFVPGASIIIKGSALKENGKDVNGFIDAEIVVSGENASDSISQQGTINNGFFSFEIPVPSDMKAGAYLIKLNAYEKDTKGEITNKGFLDYNIAVKQVPTNLELIIENEEVEPATNLKLKAILHDQSGESIDSTSVITLKNNQDIVIEQTEITNGEDFEYPIKYNEAPTEWKVVAESSGLITEMPFTIMEKASVNVEIINKTIMITNDGNVFYNKTVLVKIGNESLNIYVELGVDGSQKYILNAPEGEYPIEIVTQEGKELSETAFLTGKAIGIKEAKTGIKAAKSFLVWIFLIMVLGVVAFMIFRKVHKKSFFGHMKGLKKKDKIIRKPLGKKALVTASNKAELSLSIKGDKQDVSVVCLQIKNLDEIESTKGNAKDTLQKIVDGIAEKNKAAVYENQGNIFFILAPIKTKTYKNEKSSIQISREIKKILSEHNKSSNQKIDFGISLNYGKIIAKQEGRILKFMSMGTLITGAKKIASLAKREVLLSERINEKMRSYVKTEKHTREKVPVYMIKQIKKEDEESKKFIRSFLKRIEKKD